MPTHLYVRSLVRRGLGIATSFAPLVGLSVGADAYPDATPDFQPDVAPDCAACHASTAASDLAGLDERALAALAPHNHDAALRSGETFRFTVKVPGGAGAAVGVELADRPHRFIARSAGFSLLLEHLVECLLLECEISHKLLEALVLVLELPQLLDLARRPPDELLLPAREGLLADSQLPAGFNDRGTVPHLLQRQGDLLIRISTLLHGVILPF
jgi:hypothetical protein